jgi:hypothetical protein
MKKILPVIKYILHLIWRLLKLLIAILFACIAVACVVVSFDLDYHTVTLPNGFQLKPVYWNASDIALYDGDEVIIPSGIYQVMYTHDAVYGRGGGGIGNDRSPNMPFFAFYYSRSTKERASTVDRAFNFDEFLATKNLPPFDVDIALTYKDIRSGKRLQEPVDALKH